MMSKSGVGDSLGNVVNDIGIINEIHCDKIMEKLVMNAEIMSKARKYNIHVSYGEPYSL